MNNESKVEKVRRLSNTSNGWQARVRATIQAAAPARNPVVLDSSGPGSRGPARFDKDDIDREERAYWRSASAERYVRVAGEYTSPARDLILVSHEAAATVRWDDRRPFADLPAIWRAVRGSDLAKASGWDYGGRSAEVYAELVPLPGNPHDGTALGIDLDGRHVGYAPASYAEHAHWSVRQLNVLGYRVLVSGFFTPTPNPWIGETVVEMSVALPTLAVLNAHSPTLDDMIPRFRALWDALPASRRERIAAAWYSVDDDDMPDLMTANRPELAIALPTLPVAEALPFYAHLCLRDLREEAAEARAVAKAARDQEVVEYAQQGSTASVIGERVGLSAATVRRIVSDAGLSMKELAAAQRKKRSDAVWDAPAAVSSAMRPGMSEQALSLMKQRIARCAHALELQRSGMSFPALASSLGVSQGIVERLVQDGRFYENPASNEARLERARAIRASPVKRSERSKAQQRSVNDGSVLDAMYDGWAAYEPSPRG